MGFNSGFKGLNRLVLCAERRNLVSAHVCAITFQTHSTCQAAGIWTVGWQMTQESKLYLIAVLNVIPSTVWSTHTCRPLSIYYRLALRFDLQELS